FSLSEKSVAQTTKVTSGIYVTVKDFQDNKLMEEADCKKDKAKFEIHDFLAKESFVVIIKGQKKTYLKKDIYGYRDCENEVWRFYNNKEYRIMETKPLCIYSRYKVEFNSLIVEKDLAYYFSKGLTEEIKDLSIDTLKLAFPNNHAFHNMLDTEFNPDKAIYSYDSAHKMFKVNYLFTQSEK
ncbi:MAG TPA: hypothetical protein VF411_06425, partial [Bacteroidia bacterium]